MKQYCVALLVLLCLSVAAVEQTEGVFLIRAGSKPDAKDMYSAEHGFGFEPDSTFELGKPFSYSISVPEGNYRVSIGASHVKAESTLSIKAESRQLMLENRTIPAGEATHDIGEFTVNVHRAAIASGGSVKLKTREAEYRRWDNKLTLEIFASGEMTLAVRIKKIDDAITVFIAGDSTVADQPAEPFNSWGQMLPRFFKSGVAVANHAESGESLKSSLGAKRFDKIFSQMKAGDYLLIQFGHNDQKDKTPGAGAFTTYKDALKSVVAATKKHGGIPVVVTSVQRRNFDANGKIVSSLGEFPEAVRQVAKEESVALIDLHAMSKPFYEAMGPEESKKAFAPNDNTHHNNYGSYELARCIVEGIKLAKLPLADFIAADVKPFDPAHPDPIETFKVPASPQKSAPKKPDGN